ncbi:hypothetical protein Ahy_B01g055560 [Arachis hypogaea]|uniref:Transposase MuDR plant domain-containing protein n=1 Tax=Arachis hypogaea TaxID=3818 RepID=A0A445AWJ2_ARAHY|nr:hypothetical protein Ahy_B01g055560 [Arachis hypogaea]
MPIIDEAKEDRIQNDSDIEDDRAEVYEGMNNDSEEDFETTYEVGDKDEDGDVGSEAAVENVVVLPAVSQPMDISPFMRNLDLDAIHALEFSEYANIGVADLEDGEFRIGIEVTLSLEESTTICISLSHRRSMQNARRMGDHFKLDSDTVVEVIRPLIETDLSIKVKSIIAEVQLRFNYTISYRKAWLAKQKSIAKVFFGWKDSYQALTWWFSIMIEANMQRVRNIVVHRFVKRNEVFEVHEMPNGKVLGVDLARRSCDCRHFQGHSRGRCPQRVGPSGVGDDDSP